MTQVFEAPKGDCTKMASQMTKYTDEVTLQHFFKCVGLCHDCIIVNFDNDEIKKTEKEEKTDLLYQG